MKNKIILIIIVFLLGIKFVDAKSNIDLSVLHDLDDVEIVDYEEKTFCTTTMEDINGNVFIVNEFEIAEKDLNNIDEIIAFEESKYPKTNQNSRAFQETYSTTSKTISMDYYRLKSEDANVYNVYVLATWQTVPSKKDYDVIAIRWTNGASLMNATGYQRSNNDETYYSYMGSNMNVGSNGVGISMNLHNGTSGHELHLNVKFRASSVGKVYASYQHAINASTTLALSKDYVFASNGLGQVIKFNNNTTAGYYDGMNGIYVDGYIGPLEDYYDYS